MKSAIAAATIAVVAGILWVSFDLIARSAPHRAPRG